MIKVQAPQGAAVNTTWEDTPTQTINVGGVELVYRQLGPDTGAPVVFLTHLAAVLDDWDPESWTASLRSIGSSPSTT
jgi:pimeloyl-ACP methyl ester carboxylesterase